jgi:hypothetical protein
LPLAVLLPANCAKSECLNFGVQSRGGEMTLGSGDAAMSETHSDSES